MARMVKGTLFVNFVKTLKKLDKEKLFPYLKATDLEIIHSTILPSGWYPFDVYKRCFLGVMDLYANNSMEEVRKWGLHFGESIMSSFYSVVISAHSPFETLKRYTAIFNKFYNFGDCRVEQLDEHSATLTITEFDPDFEALYYLIAGWIEWSLSQEGDRNISIEFIKKSWKGDSATVYQISWQN